jgi:insertion element IS1 protein InsB
VENKKDVVIQILEGEADAVWSVVGNKNNKHWVWLAMAIHTRQIIAFHGGARSQDSAQQLWKHSPETYRQQATFYTDHYASYGGVIPATPHRAVAKESGKVNHLERFNCTLRQRVSRLVRKALSFSKKLKNHIGAIKYFICCYNLSKTQEALHS